MYEKIKTASEILAQTAANLYDVRHNPTEAAVIAAYDNIKEAKESLDAAKAGPSLDRETRLRMIAEAVSGLSNKDWCDAKRKINSLFSCSVNVAANNAVIDRTTDEIADIIVKQER